MGFKYSAIFYRAIVNCENFFPRNVWALKSANCGTLTDNEGKNGSAVQASLGVEGLFRLKVDWLKKKNVVGENQQQPVIILKL